MEGGSSKPHEHPLDLPLGTDSRDTQKHVCMCWCVSVCTMCPTIGSATTRSILTTNYIIVTRHEKVFFRLFLSNQHAQLQSQAGILSN